MFKFALIINAGGGASPDTYSAVYENNESYNLFAGVSDMEMASDFVKRLTEDGFELINLCGDFDDEITQSFIKKGEGKLRVFHADYFPSELKKLEVLPSYQEYGFVSITRGLKTMEQLEIFGKACNTKIMLVKDLEMACQAARELVEKGVFFIELCSWFDSERTQAVIDATGGKVPIGSCGPIK